MPIFKKEILDLKSMFSVAFNEENIKKRIIKILKK